MDNHPIPQDVTGFQFRLIGDMTIKQFAYLAGGVILAWIFLASPLYFLIKLPFVIFFGGMGLILAFIPISGRPADTMIFYFFRAVFSPTQYTYKSPAGQQQTSAVEQQPVAKLVKKESKQETVHLETPLQAVQDLPQQAPSPIPTPVAAAPTPQPAPQEALPEQPPATNGELSSEALAVANALIEAKNKETEAEKGSQEAAAAHEKVEDLEKELQTIQEQKQQLEEQLVRLQQQLQQKTQTVFTPSTATPVQQTQNVRKIPPALGKTVGTPFVSDVPNLISGIVKDPRGNVLPNILIEVKDKDGNPVRAFKTNPLGQFASATPVINGTYTISFEDPNNKQRFDSVELSATGEVLSPIEVISIDAREDLRKELFGG